MTRLVWDAVGERRFETGIDRGVVYWTRPGFIQPAVVWNGLISVDEQTAYEVKPFYQNGVKFLDALVLDDFSAVVTAYTYPDEIDYLSGVKQFDHGLWFGQQKPRTFSMSYRTMVGDDTSPGDEHFRLHLLYNLRALPDARSYASKGDTPEATTFKWTVVSRPNLTSGYRAISHVIIDSKDTDPELMTLIEESVYGTESLPPVMPAIDILMGMFDGFY